MSVTAQPTAFRVAILTLLAMLAFAGNSILNRAALAVGSIDWATFTSVRLLSGACVLALLLGWRLGGAIIPRAADMKSALALFSYAAFFSLAYLELTAATGALILFACVQISMQAIAVALGHKVNALQWSGLVVAFAGLVWLLLPGLAAPPILPSLLMAAAGVSWGAYSWFGRGADHPVRATARNFIGTVPLALMILLWADGSPQPVGIMLAIASGVITSALGYVIWYAALPYLNAPVAGTVQLSVPAIAALGGVLFLSETISVRLLAATILILAGIALTLRTRH
ncbi:DMT family transporter [Sphingorhabdus sp. Alg239-R122]|uniref:DMT family transporter n=1 Tax=Sphingorhabdus sp. Alg239-R122 TaxID=2305989 RepID=UPI0013DBF6E6|nr:DMT family transporter [Sphingorhabdus sp. Alg239-R122]